MGGGFRDGGAGVSMEDDDDEYQEVREKGCNIMYIYTLYYTVFLFTFYYCVCM